MLEQCFTDNVYSVISGWAFGRLGPMPKGSILSFLEVSYNVNGATELSIVAAHGVNLEASIEGVAAGISLVQTADVTYNEVPQASWTMGAAGEGHRRFPIGVEAQAGSYYLAYGIGSNHATNQASFMLGLVVVSLQRLRKMLVGGPPERV